ncbi:hypothetical protein SNE40_019468 [Patella caerulea]|uniref:Zinc finger-containing ubiquitin peptidase 1 n=1 Tax=Patella caerulea TaxID=87958 RepID=A0AAN8PFN5_PATCE
MAEGGAACYSRPEKQYVCVICGDEGIFESEMHDHIKLHTTDNYCPFCDMAGLIGSDMIRHVNVEHLDLVSPSSEKPSKIQQTNHHSDYSKPSTSRSLNNTSDYLAASTSHSFKYNSSFSSLNDELLNDAENQDPLAHVSSLPVMEPPDKKRSKLYLDVPQRQNGLNSFHKVKQVPTKDKASMSHDSGFSSSGSQNSSMEAEPSIMSIAEGATAMSPAFSCPLCSFTTSSDSLIQQHVNREHSDILSPMKPGPGCNVNLDDIDVVYSCPICAIGLDSPKDVELHINSKHADVLSPGKFLSDQGPDDLLICPVCGEIFTDPNFLTGHVDGHFSATHTPVNEATDQLIAEELQQREQDQAEMEKKDFQTLQAMYGMDGKTDYKQQYEKNLERAVWNGHLSIPEYHKQKTNLKCNDLNGVDDGHSCTKGIIVKLQYYYKHTSSCVHRWWLATSVDHYSVSFGDKGWGCGYRNFQMLLSSVTAELDISQVLFNGKPLIPSIPKIQRLIEVAWEKGFDKQGSEQLGGRVVNTNKWIGATEIVATLSSLKIKCRLVDFLGPSGPDGTHPKLFQWVKDYFQSACEFKAPLYLQHQGHSRTIIGIEEMKDGSDRLLIFDPSISQKQMQHFQGRIDNSMLRTLRRTMAGLKAKQYQIVAVVGVLSDEEYERCKILQSEKIR